MTEYITRNDDVLTVVTIVDDPLYLAEPFVQSTTYVNDPGTVVIMESCVTSAFGDNGGTDPHFVPHFLPGENLWLTEWLEEQSWIPEAAARGGAETTYPEFVAGNASGRGRATFPISSTAVSVERRIAAQSPHDAEVHVLPVQGNVYMLIVDGTNVTASVGADGIMLVNTGPAHMVDELRDAIALLARDVAARGRTNDCFGAHCPSTPFGWSSAFMNTVISSPAPPLPIRYIINTGAHEDLIGGNAELAAEGFFARNSQATAVVGLEANASVIAHENVLFELSASDKADGGEDWPIEAWPTDTYFHDFHKLSEYFNGEAIIVYHEPAASTDGDSIVFFRHSEVISAGNLFSTVGYPYIDLEAGGTIQGVIDGLNDILDLAVAEYRSQGGTWIIPSHGRLADTADVASYRNMVTMIRDRVRSMVRAGMSLEEILAARPTMDFDGRYGATDGDWTTETFLEAVYLTIDR
jgi:glyoxylase-like metal-dependent hydrolase (beta-lactamase superfamily II)